MTNSHHQINSFMPDNPLAKKLKLIQGEKNLILQAPESFLEQLKEISFDVTPQHDEYEYVQLFVKSLEEVNQYAPFALKYLKEDGKLWFSYPKKTSGIKTDINRDHGWEVVLKEGYGGVAAVSIDDTWSALRFRHESKVDRKGPVVKGPAKPSARNRVLEIPEEVKQMLEAHPREKEYFDSLAYTHRKEYVQWIGDAKRTETRQKRLGEMLQKLKERKKRY